jgi:hypothetical protein
MLDAGGLAPGDLLWRDGMPDWVRADNISVLASDRSPPIVPPPPTDAARKREPPPVKISGPSLNSQRVADRRQGQRASSKASQTVWIGIVLAMVVVSWFWFSNMFRAQLRDGRTANRQTAEIARDDAHRTNSQGQSSATRDLSAKSGPPLAVQRKADVTEESKPVEQQTELADPIGTSRTPISADTTAAAKPAGASWPAPAGQPSRSTSKQSHIPPVERTETAIIYQEVAIQRQPTFSVQGVEIRQDVRYRIWSKLEVSAPADDGNYQVVQFVENTQLEDADELSRKAYEKSLTALHRQQFTFLLNPQNEVIRFAGHESESSSVSVDLESSNGFLLTTVIDEDGWKELTQLTFFRPAEEVKQGLTYERQMTHNWQPLGSWFGTTRFVGRDSTSDQEQISYTHHLSYVAPGASTEGLPFRIVNADFKIDEASGTIAFDRQQRRISHAQERFQVSGVVQAELLGQTTSIQLRERQLLTIRVTDQPLQ